MRPPRTSALLLLIVTLLAVVAPPAAAEPPELHTEWSVLAPRSLTGALVVGATFDFGEPQQCTFFVESSGTDSGLPILHWEEQDDFNGAFFSTYSAQAHVTDVAGTGQTIDTREVITSGGLWSLDTTTEGPFEGPLRYRMIIPDAGHWFREATGHHEALHIAVTCERGFTVDGFHLGREAVGYSQDSMAGGDGVWLSPTILGEAGVASGDAFEADMAAEEVTFRLRSATTQGTADGQARLTSPAGEHVVELDGAADDLDVVAGPGTWRLDVDRVVAGAYDDFKGIVYGMAPVEDLGEALAAAG